MLLAQVRQRGDQRHVLGLVVGDTIAEAELFVRAVAVGSLDDIAPVALAGIAERAAVEDDLVRLPVRAVRHEAFTSGCKKRPSARRAARWSRDCADQLAAASCCCFAAARICSARCAGTGW